MPFQFQRLEIPDVILITPKKFGDSRGFFMETFKQSDFKKFGITSRFVQDNYSHSEKGVLRGMHYQKHPVAQAKLVTIVKGEVFDVAVDIRKGSLTFGKWIGVTLSDKKPQMLFIPEGFAHGFCVLSETADFTYKVSADYSPENEGGFIWNDPDIGIEWPTKHPKLSDKDLKMPLFKDTDMEFTYNQK
jgi:dTDP-4-dehydrorhamnose 3,5-epimerase